MRIGELSARHGLSTATVRYYESLGLLGEAERSESGYRLFTSDDEARLRFILRAKALDLSLDEIRSLLDAWDLGSCQEARTTLRHLVAHKIREARTRAQEAEAFAVQLGHVYDRLGDRPETDGDCRCIPELPSAATLDLEQELAMIEQSVCSCGGRLDELTACACGCCTPTGSERAGELSPDILTIMAADGDGATEAIANGVANANGSDAGDGNGHATGTAFATASLGGGASTLVHLGPTHARGGDPMTTTNETLTFSDAPTATCSCGCCGPKATLVAETGEETTPKPIACSCGTGACTGEPGSCGPDCTCGGLS